MGSSAREECGITEGECSSAPSVADISAKMINSSIKPNARSSTLKMTNAAHAINSASGAVSR